MKNTIGCFLSVILISGTTGCLNDKVSDFAPKRANVCDPIQITGTIWGGSSLDGVWFNGVQDKTANITAESTLFPPHYNPPGVISATVPGLPPGTTSANIRVKLGPGGYLLTVGTDQTLSTPLSIIGSPPVPSIVEFKPATSPIPLLGSGTTLNWTTDGATKLTLNGTDVTGQTSHPENPTHTTTYILVASDSCLATQQTTSIVVSDTLGALSFNPASISMSRGQSTSITASIPQSRPVVVALSCPTQNGLSCSDATIPVGATSTLLTITASAAAPLETISAFGVNAKEALPGTAASSGQLSVTVDRQAGSFSQIKSTVQPAVGATGSAGSCSVSVKNNNGAFPNYDSFSADLKCSSGTNKSIGFSSGGPFGLGGVGFSSNSALAVVTSRTQSTQPLTFDVLQLPALSPVTGYQAYDTSNQPSASQPPAVWASPDASLIIVTTLTQNASATDVYSLNLHAVPSTSSLYQTQYQKSLDSAQVVNVSGHQYVYIYVDGKSTPLSYMLN